jgi:hypothetical protein
MSTLNGQHRESADDPAVITEAMVEVVSDPSEVQSTLLYASDADEAAILRGNIGALSGARTRFTPEDIQCGEETSVDQGVTVEARHTLDTRTKSMEISGRFLVAKGVTDFQSDNTFTHERLMRDVLR